MLVRRSKTICKKSHLALTAVESPTYSGDCNSVEVLSAKLPDPHRIRHSDTFVREDLTLCVRNMPGFINVAITTDDISFVTENITRKYAKPEAIVQGELATRTGSRLKHCGSSYCTENCLPAALPFTEVIKHLVNDSRSTESSGQLLAACGAIDQTMREQFPFDAKWTFLWSKI